MLTFNICLGKSWMDQDRPGPRWKVASPLDRRLRNARPSSRPPRIAALHQVSSTSGIELGSQNFVNALGFYFVNTSDPNQSLITTILNGFYIYCHIPVHWTIILIHILSVHFAINAQDDSAYIGGGWRGPPADWRSAEGCSARLHHDGCLDLQVV